MFISSSGKLYTYQVLQSGTVSIFCLAGKHYLGTNVAARNSHSMYISPAKLSSASALLYDYLNAIQSTSNLSYISIFASIL